MNYFKDLLIGLALTFGLFHSSILFGFSNPTADSLVQLAQATTDFDQKLKFYNDIFNELRKTNDSTTVKYASQLIDFSIKNDFQEGIASDHYNLGFFQLINGQFQESIGSYKTAFNLYEKLDSTTLMLSTNRNIGICFERLGLADSILYYAKNGLAIAEKSKSPEHLILAHQRLGEYYGFTAGNVKKGIFHLDYAIDLVKKEKLDEYLLNLMYAKGATLVNNGDLSGAELLQEAETLAIKENPKLLVYIRQMLIFTYHQKGEIRKAIEVVNKNLADAQRINDKTRIASTYSQLGDLYKSLYDTNRAIEYYQKAIDFSEQHGQYNEKISSLFGLGILYSNELAFAQAKKVHEEAVHLADSLGNPIDAHRVLPELGTTYLKLNEFEKAKTSFLRVINESENQTNINEAKAGMGQYLILKKQYTQAEPFLIEAYDFANQQDNIYLKNKTAEQLSLLHRATKNYEEAIKWTDINIEYSDSINLDENRAKMTAERMNAKFATEKKLIAFEQQKKEEILRLENQQTRYIAGGIGLLALLLLGFFWNARQKNKTISQQNAQLEQLNTTKDRLFAIIGHDLRKPAISFRGISKKVNYLIRNKDFPTLEKLGTQIEQNALSLNKLTDNLLNWALMQRDVMPYNPQEILLEEIIDDVQTIFAAPASEKNIQLKLDIPNGLSIYADPNALTTILTNLVDNAIKYTSVGGVVTITAVAENSQVKIRVADTGIGMDKDKINDIFLLEKNKSEKGTAGEKGTGLGLHLVKELVQLNKGVISTVSELGKGTQFNISLPKMALH